MPEATLWERLDALPMQIRLAPVSAIDAEARTIELVWTTGAAVRRRRYDRESGRAITYDEILIVSDKAVDLSRLNSGAAVLDSHNAYSTQSQVAVVERASIDGGEGRATVRFPKPDVDEAADRMFALVADRIVRNVSVGYSIDKVRVEKPEQAGEVEKWFAERWTPYELSFVTIGADPGAQVRSDLPDRLFPFEITNREEPGHQENHAMSKTDEVPGNAPAEDQEPPAPAETRAATEPPTAAAQVSIDQVRTEERDRITAITGLVDQFKLDRAVADDLVKRNVSVEQAHKVILDKLAERDARGIGHSQISTPAGGLDERITRREAVTNALLHRYSPTLFSLSQPAREYRGMTLLELAREFLSSAGVNVRGLSRDEIATRALHSTSDFPEILSAVTNKTLRQAYDVYPRTFVPFCRQVLASDFKPMNRVQIGEVPQLLKVNESGEFKRGTIAESKESYRIETYGRVVGITRQVLINDDLDAFTRIPAMYGTAIATLESDVVWSVILANAAMADGVALFHANHKNLAASGAALSVTAVGDGRAAMAKQTGLDKKTVLNIRPAFLLIPSALELAAEQLIAQNLVPAKTGDVVPQSIRTLLPIAEPRLDNASATAWYLAANPAQIDTIEYAYLEGQEGAYIETRNGFDVDGAEIKCRLDFGAKAIDWRGLYKNPGA